LAPVLGALFVNLLSQEYRLPPLVSVFLLGLVLTFQVFLEGHASHPGSRRFSTPPDSEYLTNLVVSSLLGFLLTYIVLQISALSQPREFVLGFGESIGALIVISALCIFSGTIARTGRPARKWIGVLAAGYFGVYLVNTNASPGAMIQLAEYWLASILLVLGFTRWRSIWRDLVDLRTVPSGDPLSGRSKPEKRPD
jgi:hypothetical protein